MAAAKEHAWQVDKIADLIGVKRRTLALWLKQGTAPASIAAPRGRFQRVLLSLEDVLEVSMIAFLRKEKVPMQRVKRILRRLREKEQRLTDFEVLLVTGDGEVIGCRGRLSAMALARHPGQVLLLPVAMWKKQAAKVRHEAQKEVLCRRPRALESDNARWKERALSVPP